MRIIFRICIILFVLTACGQKGKTPGQEQTSSDQATPQEAPFVWENANIYFLLTDRFYNGDTSNDVNFGRNKKTAVLRGFEGGDLMGVTQKIEEGYFNDLGVNAIWFTPVVEQIHGLVNEGTGATYGYHGYWAHDWSSLDPNFGNSKSLAKLVKTAHQHGIRVIMDVVINHTGPVTDQDPAWPAGWVRTSPKCQYSDYNSTVTCTLVDNLPDIKTESKQAVELPEFLKEKWKKEGRLEQETMDLEAFFKRTGYPRAPAYYIIKWLTDYVRRYGIDGFRVDTAKHTEAFVWAALYKQANKAFAEWKQEHPADVLDDNDFFMFGEVYGYNISSERMYDYGDRKVDFFKNGFKSLINFEFKSDATHGFEDIFFKYDRILHGGLAGQSVVNYLSSHDDGEPFDLNREKPLKAATKLLLTPGASQIYYGDETARVLHAEGAAGDANLRSFMNWDELKENTSRHGIALHDIQAHWQKLGRFRTAHPAVGAGRHNMISEKPYWFKRSYEKGNYRDVVLVGLGLKKGLKSMSVSGIFEDGTVLKDYYSGAKVLVQQGKIAMDSPFAIVLLGR